MCRNKDVWRALSARGYCLFVSHTYSMSSSTWPVYRAKRRICSSFPPSGSAAVGGSVTVFAQKTSSPAGARSSCRCSFVGSVSPPDGDVEVTWSPLCRLSFCCTAWDGLGSLWLWDHQCDLNIRPSVVSQVLDRASPSVSFSAWHCSWIRSLRDLRFFLSIFLYHLLSDICHSCFHIQKQVLLFSQGYD